MTPRAVQDVLDRHYWLSGLDSAELDTIRLLVGDGVLIWGKDAEGRDELCVLGTGAVVLTVDTDEEEVIDGDGPSVQEVWRAWAGPLHETGLREPAGTHTVPLRGIAWGVLWSGVLWGVLLIALFVLAPPFVEWLLH